MKNKVVIIISIIVAILIILVGMLMFTGLGEGIRDKISIQKEDVTIEEQEYKNEEQKHIKVTYTYLMENESFDIDVTDKERIKMIDDSILNKEFDDYSEKVSFPISGIYKVNLGNNIDFSFARYDAEGFVNLNNKGQYIVTKINPQILRKVQDIVDKKITENAQIFKTDKVTITNKEDKQISIERKTALDYIFNECRECYFKELDYKESDFVKPNYLIDFNNGVKMLMYSETGFLIKDEIQYELFYITSNLDSILEYTFDEDIDNKEQMFSTDKITITNPNKTIEITDKDIIEKITTPIIYSHITPQELSNKMINNLNIIDEYNNGTKIKVNDYEILISTRTDNIYIISSDKKIKPIEPLQGFRKYVNELLENEN